MNYDNNDAFWNIPDLKYADIIPVPRPGKSYRRYMRESCPNNILLYYSEVENKFKVFFATNAIRNLWIDHFKLKKLKKKSAFEFYSDLIINNLNSSFCNEIEASTIVVSKDD